jgi:hypothetical protein
VMSRARSAFWLLASILVACSGPAPGFQARFDTPSVSHGAARLTSQARSPQPSLLPRGLPSVVASEAQRQKATRGHARTTSGIVPEEVPLRALVHQGLTPILHRDVRWTASVRAFEPRGPPSLIG